MIPTTLLAGLVGCEVRELVCSHCYTKAEHEEAVASNDKLRNKFNTQPTSSLKFYLSTNIVWMTKFVANMYTMSTLNYKGLHTGYSESLHLCTKTSMS